jgi:hypothetical protein
MERNSAYQEILLIRATSFVTNVLTKKDDARHNDHLFDNERLEEACWNGMVQTKLPELFLEVPDCKGFFIWQINEAEFFLVLEMGETPTGVDGYSSISPYLFVATQSPS